MGLHFIPYLDPGHYFGIDKYNDLLNAGRNIELGRNKLVEQYPTLVNMHDFEFPSLERQFDYALAQSVYSDLPLSSIMLCVMNIEKVLVVGGQFYATFWENPQGKFNIEPITYRRAYPPIISHFDSDSYQNDFETFRYICEDTGLRVEYIGEWKHPRSQMMLAFTKI